MKLEILKYTKRMLLVDGIDDCEPLNVTKELCVPLFVQFIIF